MHKLTPRERLIIKTRGRISNESLARIFRTTTWKVEQLYNVAIYKLNNP